MMADCSLNMTSENLSEIPESVFETKANELILDFNSITVLPSEFCEKLSHLSILSLNGNGLESLPSEIVKLTSLRELYLKENFLQNLPDNIHELKCLQKLYITGNNLESFPKCFPLLQNLTELIADENEIRKLPSDFGLLHKLSYLDLSYNSITELPESFGNIENLSELSLSDNSLMSLPSSFQNLSSVKIIDLSVNQIGSLPENFLSAPVLEKILISNNRLSSLPMWFAKLHNVTEIYLDNNSLQEAPFPEDFGDVCQCLEYLDVRGNNINALPSSFKNLSCLKTLHLGTAGEPERSRFLSSGNSIRELPQAFPHLPNLAVFEIDENNIAKLPEDFGHLSKIVYLNLSHNDLTKLPDSFCELQNMKVCMLSVNFLTCLPQNFGNLSSLEELKLDDNMLTGLPESFGKLSNLVSLDLFRNKLKEIPPCLKQLKSLKVLDMNENDLGISMDEIPDIAIPARYLAHKPELQNNWRGRKRDDIQDELWVDENDQKESKSSENDILSYALKYSSSLWRKHGDDSSRKISASVINGHTEETNGVLVSDNSGNSQNDSVEANNNSDSTENWDLELMDIKLKDDPGESSVSSGASCANNFENSSDLSDWETDDYENSKNFRRVYMHPSEKNRFEFVPSDIHVKSIKNTEIWHCVEDGQFDDADGQFDDADL